MQVTLIAFTFDPPLLTNFTHVTHHQIFCRRCSASLLFSFTGRGIRKFTGTYGVQASDPSCIKLILNADHSFYFQDFSVATDLIVGQGSWASNGNRVTLNGSKAETNFHRVWIFDTNGQVARSRKGFSYYRLSKLK